MKNKKIILILIVCFTIFALWKLGTSSSDQLSQLVEGFHSEFSDVHHISTEELSSWLENTHIDSPILLDVRSRDEYEVSHLLNAIHVNPKSEFIEILQDKDKSSPIVLYCSVGYRSAIKARELQNRGYSNVQNLKGSIFLWANEGRKVFRNNKSVNEVHIYNEYWGKFLNKKYHAKNL